VYVAADPENTERVTVPVLWDTQEDTIVNNESIETMRMFAAVFDDVGDEGTRPASRGLPRVNRPYHRRYLRFHQ